MPISFQRLSIPSPPLTSLTQSRTLSATLMGTITIGGCTLLTIQRGWEVVEQEEALVGTPSLPPAQEGVDAPYLATRFLFLLAEELHKSQLIHIVKRLSRIFNRFSAHHHGHYLMKRQSLLSCLTWLETQQKTSHIII